MVPGRRCSRAAQQRCPAPRSRVARSRFSASARPPMLEVALCSAMLFLSRCAFSLTMDFFCMVVNARLTTPGSKKAASRGCWRQGNTSVCARVNRLRAGSAVMCHPGRGCCCAPAGCLAQGGPHANSAPPLPHVPPRPGAYHLNAAAPAAGAWAVLSDNLATPVGATHFIRPHCTAAGTACGCCPAAPANGPPALGPRPQCKCSVHNAPSARHPGP
jgi:hypothetical protein